VKMFRRAILATSFVASLPQWDGTRLIAEGHSQGGGQALASAAFSSHVDALVVSCPTHCDHTAKPAGWPKILQEEDEADRVREVQYIDGVNFAARVSCPALFGICFLDTLCPPTGVFAAYNALQASKSAHHDPVTGHVYTDAFQDLTYRWVGKLLAATGNR